MKEVSIIIVSYNSLSILAECLDSIKKYNDIGKDLEVIVSDNSPSNQVVEYLNKNYRWVRTRKNKNIGFGAGNNRGVEISSGRILAFLNPDTILVEPIFKYVVEKFDKNPSLSVLGLQLVSRELTHKPSFYLYPTYEHGIINTLIEKFFRNFGWYIDRMMYIAGADLFVRREAFEHAGRFDEAIFMYNEEPDLIKRIKTKTGWRKTAFYKDKKIIHLEGGTSQQDPEHEYNLRKIIIEADKYYASKWGLDIKNILKAKRRYVVFKSLILRFIDKEKYANQNKIIALFNDTIKSIERKNTNMEHGG